MMTASEDEDAVFHEQDMKYDERTGEWVYHVCHNSSALPIRLLSNSNVHRFF